MESGRKSEGRRGEVCSNGWRVGGVLMVRSRFTGELEVFDCQGGAEHFQRHRGVFHFSHGAEEGFEDGLEEVAAVFEGGPDVVGGFALEA